MIDVVAATYEALARGSIAAAPIAFAAGVVTSVGPCVAPRYLALAAVLRGERRRIPIVCAFVVGVIAAYLCIGCAAGFLGLVTANSRIVYVAMASALAVAGAITLVRVPGTECATHAARPAVGRESGTFLLGAASALVVSPCCTPIVGAFASFATIERAPLAGALLLAAYALGHALPFVGAALAGERFSRPLARRFPAAATSVVSASLFFALAGWYACVA